MLFSQKTVKPWGWEILFTPSNLPYTGKILLIKAGKKLSLQYHDQKQETLCLLEGEGILWLEDNNNQINKLPLRPKTGYTINQGQKHRVEAIKDCLIVESSTPETGKTYRVEDDYGREDEKLTEKESK